MKEMISPAAYITAPELWFIGQYVESDKEMTPDTATSFREYYY